jgi:hypothetical protein
LVGAGIGAGALGAVAGCGLISGADALHVGTIDGIEPRDGGAGAETDASTARPDPLDSGAADAAVLDGAQPDAADAGYVRSVTFENMLTGPGGADVVTGNVTLVTGTLALSGTHSMRADKDTSVADVSFPPMTELYATLLIRFERVGLGDKRILRLLPELLADGVVEIVLPDNGAASALQVSVGGAAGPTGGSVNEGGPVYRVGIHMRHDAMRVVEVFLASQGVPFGPAVITALAPAGRTKGIQFGSAGNVGNMRVVVDDLLVDTTSMPAP